VKILFDTNIILDVMLDREPFSDLATKLICKNRKTGIRGVARSNYGYNDILPCSQGCRKKKGRRRNRKIVVDIRDRTGRRIVLAEAIRLKFDDFEDAVLHEAAKQADLQGIVTRNTKNFQNAAIPTHNSPEELKMFFSMI